MLKNTGEYNIVLPKGVLLVAYIVYTFFRYQTRHPKVDIALISLGGHSEVRRDGLPKALDVGEVSIVTGSRRRSFHPVTG